MPAGTRARRSASPVAVAEVGAHGQADADLGGLAADDVGEQARPLLELDVGQHVGHGVAERRHLVLLRSP